MTIHRLKTWPEPFEAVMIGIKRFEFRKDDRGFEVGDTLVLQEWRPAPGYYTGYEYVCTVPYLIRGPAFGIPAGYVVMSLSEPAIDGQYGTRLMPATAKEVCTLCGGNGVISTHDLRPMECPDCARATT